MHAPIKYEAFCGSTSWSIANVFISVKNGLEFKSCAVQTRHSNADGLPLVCHFFKTSCSACRQNNVEMGPANALCASSSLWHNTTHIMQIGSLTFRGYKFAPLQTR